MDARSALIPLLTTAALVLGACGGDTDDPADSSDSAPEATTEAPGRAGPEGLPTDGDAVPVGAPQIPGLVVHESDTDVGTTVQRLEDALDDDGTVVATINHAAAAAEAGLELAPTVLVVAGNPEAGTPLIAADQDAGLDLPQKFLVWQTPVRCSSATTPPTTWPRKPTSRPAHPRPQT